MRLTGLGLRGGRLRGGLSLLGVLLLLAACAQQQPVSPPAAQVSEIDEAPSWPVPPGAGPAMTKLRFDQVPGWSRDHAAAGLAAFVASCARMAGNPTQSLGGSGPAASMGGSAGRWRGVCDLATVVPAGDDAAARGFFEANFQAYGLSVDGSARGLFTGYYEPEIDGARTPGGRFRTPIYRRPADLGPGLHRTAYFTRAQIERGALSRKHLELLWLADPIDAFFLEIQGAGRVRLPDGQVIRVSYDGQNGRAYVPIGRVLVDRGEMTLDQVSLQTIRAWLVSHPGQAHEVMEQNPSYVFFRELGGIDPAAGPPGALGVALSPGRSVAVDKGFVPLGAPVWIDTRDPLDGTRLQRLMVAQDLGGAIRGVVRADIFFGWGRDAEERAGRMRQPGTEYILLPKSPQTAAR